MSQAHYSYYSLPPVLSLCYRRALSDGSPQSMSSAASTAGSSPGQPDSQGQVTWK